MSPWTKGLLAAAIVLVVFAVAAPQQAEAGWGSRWGGDVAFGGPVGTNIAGPTAIFHYGPAYRVGRHAAVVPGALIGSGSMFAPVFIYSPRPGVRFYQSF
jgi:hypothetical protein